MMKTGSGPSKAADTKEAVREALGNARAALGAEPPTAGLLFVSPRHSLATALAEARTALPGVTFLGCSTGGEMTERGLLHGGLVAFLIATDWPVAGASARAWVKDPLAGAARLAEPLEGLRAQGRRVGAETSATVLLVDGLANAEPLVDALQVRTRKSNRVVGGAAGDDLHLEHTEVGLDDAVGPDLAAALHFVTPRSWGVGVGQGFTPASARMRVTKAKGALLLELDGQPAQDFYRARAVAQGLALDAATWPKFLLDNVLGITLGDDVHHIRAPKQLGPDGSVAMGAPVPQGSSVCLMTGDPDSLVRAAGRAAQDARHALGFGGEAAGVLVFSCICRGMQLGEAYERELGAIRDVFPGVPLAGFLTYGEVARYQGNLDGYHNNTVVVVALPRA